MTAPTDFHRLRQFRQQRIQVPGVAGEDLRPMKAFAEQLGQRGAFFNGYQAVFAETVLEQGIRDRPGARPQFQHIALGIGGQPACHGGTQLGDWSHGTRALGLTIHSRKNTVESLSAAIMFRAMRLV